MRRGLRYRPSCVLRATGLADPPDVRHVPSLSSPAVPSNKLRAAAGEMLCKYHHALARGSRLIRSSSQFKASYPSCTRSFDRSPSLPLHYPRMPYPVASYSLSLAGVASSFGFQPYAISPEQPCAQILPFPLHLAYFPLS